MDYLQEFADLLNIFGFIGILLIAIGLATTALAYKTAEGFFIYIKSKLAKNSYQYIIFKHVIFDKFDHILSHKIPKLRTNCQSRKLIFLDLLELKIVTVKQCFEEFIKTDLNEINPDLYRLSITSLLNKITSTFYQKAQDTHIEELAVHKFEKKFYSLKDFIELLIFNVCDTNDWYKDNREKTVAIVDLLSIYESCVTKEIESSITSSYTEVSSPIYDNTATAVCALNSDFKTEAVVSVKPKKIKVLHIEDDIGTAFLMKRSLARFNMDVITAKSIMMAIELLEDNKFDAAIIDYVLPDGFGDCLEVSLNAYDTPFLYYSATAGNTLNTDAPVIQKPALPEIIKKAIEYVINNKNTSKQKSEESNGG